MHFYSWVAFRFIAKADFYIQSILCVFLRIATTLDKLIVIGSHLAFSTKADSFVNGSFFISIEICHFDTNIFILHTKWTANL